MSGAPEREIEALMSARLDRPCLFLPSGRLAVYVALRTLVSPGSRILMSPVNDDVIFFIALAAGLNPVMAPLSPNDGNIDVGMVGENLWSSVGGVLTTNLYGLPDRVEELRAHCNRLGIPLVEDVAHAIHTEVKGRLIGTFGDAAAFSLSKHVGAPCGGVLAFADDRDRAQLEQLRDGVTVAGRPNHQLIRASMYSAERLVIRTGLVWPARWVRRRLGLTERTAFRMPLQGDDLRRAIVEGPGLQPFDRWVRVDRHDYRVRPSTGLLHWTLRRLRRLQVDRARRLEGVARLRTLPIVAPAVRNGAPQPLFRVPLLVDDRKAMMARLERRIHGIGYIYDPPLDEYGAPEFAERSRAPDGARWWASRVVPVDPLEADRFLNSRA